MAKKKPLSYEEEREKWYSKLKKEGFEDIEADEYNLKVYANNRFKATFKELGPGGWQAKAAYYQMASNFLESYKFENNIEKAMWMYHTEGISYRDIAKTLNKLNKKYRLDKNSVNKTIQKLKNKMFDLYLSQDKEYRE